MDTWRTAVFQVLQASDRRVLGTAFSIFGGRVLTCRHVLCGQDKVPITPRGGQNLFNYRSVNLFRSVEQGLVTIAEWALHDQYDIACGRLADGAYPLDHIPIQTAVVMPSTSVTCAGFPASGGDMLVSFQRSVAGQSHERLIIDGALAPGFSGGPALMSGRAIGVIYADAVNESMAYLARDATVSHHADGARGVLRDDGQFGLLRSGSNQKQPTMGRPSPLLHSTRINRQHDAFLGLVLSSDNVVDFTGEGNDEVDAFALMATA